MLQREREGGQLRWQLWSSLHCPWWKREQPELKDVGVMFAMKEYCVVTTPHWAFHPSTAGRVRHRMILQFDDPDFLFEKSVQIDPSSPDGHWRPIIPIVHWSVIPGPWCQDSHHHQALCHAPPDGCRHSDDRAVDDSQLRMHGCCRGLGWASLIMFYRLTSQLGLSQPSLHLFSGLVIRHCPSSPLLLFRLGLNHRLRFPVKNQLNNLPIGIG